MNRKGQVLVSFIIFIPIFLIILALIVEIGNLVLQKNRIDSISYIILDYTLDNIDSIDVLDKGTYLLLENDNNIVINSYTIEDNKIYLNITYKVEGIFSNIINTDNFILNNKYIAYFQDNKKIIDKKAGEIYE